jgi:serine/threonine-protein kinase
VTTDPIIGTTVLNRYRVVARLAAGGMGVVYLARVEGAAGFAKPIVVKRILPEHTRNENMARLFILEA